MIMEIVKYLCEFFFTNFWHWLGLAALLEIVFGNELIKIDSNKNVKDK